MGRSEAQRARKRWRSQVTTPTGQDITIVPLATPAEMDACVAVQIAVWGYSDGDVVPRRMFTLAQRIGGQVIGAVHEGAVVGFAMALPGFRDGHAYLHSHMLAVLPEFRNAGLGRRLKLAQRDEALARGFALMEWTFDPLEIKNSYLNIARLGAISRRYHPDFYGASSSPLQGGLPTDRLYAEWWLRSDRVVAALKGGAIVPREREAATEVRVPHEIYAWKEDAARRNCAEATQRSVREQLQDAFSRGLVVSGYAREADGSGVFLLGAALPGLSFHGG